MSFAIIFAADLRRRKLSNARFRKAPFLTWLDLLGPAAAAGSTIFALSLFLSVLSVSSPPSAQIAYMLVVFGEMILGLTITNYLWLEGKHTIQFQRPNGIVVGQFLVLAGTICLVAALVHHFSLGEAGWLSVVPIIAVVAVAGGAALLLSIVPRFLKGKEEHRIVQHLTEWGEGVQAEYHPPTPECPRPDRWRMFDSMSAELEVLDFLECLIVTLKPDLVVETGTFIGRSTLRMAAGVKKNGFGKIVTCEFDPIVYGKAEQSIMESGLADWIELRNESSLETRIDGPIDFFFSDSDIPMREQEVRRFLPQISPFGMILMHDASSHHKHVRSAALKLEQEGLISVVLLSTPRGLVVAQKREGRK